MDLLSKAKPWVVASMLAATSLFGQQDKCRPQKSYEQSGDMAQAQMTPGYNAPARIDVRGSWDVYVTGSFIYFQPTQDNMEVGFEATTAGSATLPVAGSVVNMGSSYKPGFKVGLGMNFDYDNWDAFAEYTRLHCTESASATAPTGGALYSYTHPPGDAGSTTSFSSLSDSWRLNMDLLDFQMARASYVGTKLTVRSHFGARAAWITQRRSTEGTELTATTTEHEKVTSWGLGLRAGMQSDWNLGCGFRFFGNGAADLLFTQYQWSATSYDPVNSEIADLSASQSDLNTVRPHADLEFGFGWGSYFDNNNWHVDFAAGYGFQVFWDQNMFRRFYSTVRPGLSYTDQGNLYLQGLTITARLDF